MCRSNKVEACKSYPFIESSLELKIKDSKLILSSHLIIVKLLYTFDWTLRLDTFDRALSKCLER